MKLNLSGLMEHLEGSTPLVPVYLLAGDEPFQLGQAADAVRAAARRQGYAERKVFFAERGFDWKELAAEQDALSLFAERRLLELRLPQPRPGDAGARVLAEWAARPAADTVLMVITGKPDRGQQRARWFTALEQAGVLVQVWPVESARLPGWLERHMRARGLKPAPEAVRLLAERVEGNLLAADQAVEKLLLLHGPGPVAADQVAEAVADSARYDLFDLVDTALAGDAARAVRMTRGLLAEGVEPPVILWALARGIREAAGVAAGGEAALGRVWARRHGVLRAACRRHRRGDWWRLLRQAARIDRMIKGLAPGSAADELVQLSLAVAQPPRRQNGSKGT